MYAARVFAFAWNTDPLAVTRRRAATAFACAAGGLIVARAWPGLPSWAWLAAAFAFAALAFAVRGVTLRLLLAGAVFLLAGGWLTLRVLERPAGWLAHALPDPDGTLVTLEGCVLSTPHEVRRDARGLRRFLPRSATWSLEFDADTLETDAGRRAVTGRAWVRVAGEAAPSVHAGDRVRLTAIFRPLGQPTNPGEVDARDFAAQRGYAGTLALTSADLIVPLDRPRGAWSAAVAAARRAHDAVRARASRAVDDALADAPDDARALVRALLLGDVDPSHADTREAFGRIGLAHALSISGFHLAVMAAFALFVLRLTGDRGYVEPLVVAFLVVLYALVVPASSPILRSAAMVLVLLGAEAFGRRYDRVTLVLWVGVALLAWRPLDLWSLGYQLSLGLTAALVWLGPPFAAALWRDDLRGLSTPREPGLRTALVRHMKHTLAAAVLCWVLATPVLMHSPGLLSPLAALATVVVTPLIVLLLWAGYAGVVLAALVPGAAHVTAPMLAGLARASSAAVAWFDALPLGSTPVPPTPGLWALTATAALAIFIRWGRFGQARWWALFAALLAWLGVHWSVESRLPASTLVRVDMLDVGDGTCMLVRSGREAMLWDAGGRETGGLVPRAVAACRDLGAWRVGTLIITHPDLDHFVALEGVLRPLGIRRALVPARFAAQAAVPGSAAAEAWRVLREAGVEVLIVQAGDTWTMGHAGVRILSPPDGAPWTKDNDHAIVAAFGVESLAGPRRVLLTGDIEGEAIARLRAQGTVHAEVLEAPHHGSARQIGRAHV